MEYKSLAIKTFLYGILTSVIVIISYNLLDRQVVSYIYDSDIFDALISTIAAIISQIFSPKVWVAVTIFIALVCVYKRIIHKKSIKIYTMFSSLVVTILVTTIIKVLLARYRPEILLFGNKYGFHFLSFKKAYNSMPSGHTALTFAGLLSISNFFNKKIITIIFVIICCLVAISRIILLDHFISDVVVAGYLGIFIYLWSKALIEK